MKPGIKPALTLWAALSFTSTVFVLAQDIQSAAAPSLPSGVLGPQLIVWTHLTAPQPLPQALPVPVTPVAQSQSAPASGPNARPQPRMRFFTGKIIRDRGKYFLRVSSESYTLDDQAKAGQYDDRVVKLAANVDEDGHTLRVISIELIS
jgi:hypothetical protein